MIEKKVIHGDGIGKQIGYPTANLDCAPDEVALRDGVYAARSILYGKEYESALIVRRATSKVEVYLLDYVGEDFYDATISVRPIQKISEIEEMHPDGIREKIISDLRLVKEALNEF